MKIFDEPQHIDPPTSYVDDRSPTLVAQSSKVHRASISGKKMTGRNERPPLKPSPSSASLTGQLPGSKLDSPMIQPRPSAEDYDDDQLLSQVMQWLQTERSKQPDSEDSVGPKAPNQQSRRTEQDLSLDRLEHILQKFGNANMLGKPKHHSRRGTGGMGRRGSLARALMKTSKSAAASDTEGVVDSVAEVPHIEASLDNTQTLSYAGGAADTSTEQQDQSEEQKAWQTFKQDIVRLTHTLGLRGWRRLPIEYAAAIAVERLSGALTNAVYVVKPPKDYTLMQRKDDQGNLIPVKKEPKRLLLRIYGPQVEHLIDRENELLILRRLAVKNIGPKLLGYFDNGRFEEFLHARTLTAEDIRDPSTSKQIAKRMKELHEGIDLLESERHGGAFVFMNWDKWVDRVEEVIQYLDKQVHLEASGKSPSNKKYTRRGLICGVEWKQFKEAYYKYRKHLIKVSGGESGIRKRLAFAHNDAQYGNLMKLEPDDKSPLLLPTNNHKQLVVIDFEYASANTRGLEFVNHFTEWCYNYHHAERPYACNTNQYPTPEEQYRFIRAYVMHRPQYVSSASSTPNMEAREKTNIPDFMLDVRGGGAALSYDYEAEEKTREKEQEKEIQRLMQETRLWRIANSAQWVAWGIVQAQIPELDKPRKKSIAVAVIDKVKSVVKAKSDPLDEDVLAAQEDSKHDRPESRPQEEAHKEGEEEAADEEEFDYLAYAQERAMFFWGDCLAQEIIQESELPEDMLQRIKLVRY